MDNFYRDNILDHYRHPKNFGKILKPDASTSVGNPLCGDEISMNIRFKKKAPVIDDVRFQGVGCAISIASASMLTEEIKGMQVTEVKKLTKDFILNLLGIELTPTRLKCALLALETLHKALTPR